VALLVPIALTGCMSYAPSQVAAMSTYNICWTQSEQGANLPEESRRLLRTELERRKESCAAHRDAIQAQRDYELYERMYGGQSP
jgi:uncharacterized membrane protein